MPLRPATKAAGAPASTVIGADSSTRSTKAVIVDVSTGRLLAVRRALHTVTGRDGARESDPETGCQALRTSVAAALAASGPDPAALAGRQHGLATLDADGAPLRPALLWNDTRSAPQAAALTAEPGPDAWLDRVTAVLDRATPSLLIS